MKSVPFSAEPEQHACLLGLRGRSERYAADQRGHVYATRHGFGIRWRDAAASRHRRSGFATKRAAREWLREELTAGLRPDRITFGVLVDLYLEAHAVGRTPGTITTLRERLKRPVDVFGKLDLRDLEMRSQEIATWTTTLPERSRFGIVQAFRQTLETGIRWGYMRTNPAKAAGKNPQPKPIEVEPFTLDEIDRLAVELGPLYGPMVVFASETGLRPSEWIALQRGDVLPGEGVVVIARTFSRGTLKGYGKTARSRRRVPLSARAIAALDDIVPRLNSQRSSPVPAARTSTSTTSDHANGSRRSTRQASLGAESTTCGTRRSVIGLLPGSAASRSPASPARRPG